MNILRGYGMEHARMQAQFFVVASGENINNVSKAQTNPKSKIQNPKLKPKCFAFAPASVA